MDGQRGGVVAVPLPRAPVKVWVRAGSEPPARVVVALVALDRAWAAERTARQATQDAVAVAIRSGATWGRVGAVLGLSTEGARCRHRAHVAAGA